MYSWIPTNKEIFDDTFNSIEEAVAEAQKQYDEKYEMYEDNSNNTEIYLMTVHVFNVENYLDNFGESIIDLLDCNLYDFTNNIDSEVYCNNKEEFNKEVKSALLPLIKKYISFNFDAIGDFLDITYNVKTRKYYWKGQEYNNLPIKL